MEGTAIDPTQDVSTVQQEENDEDTVSPNSTPVHTPDVVAMIHTLTTHISELQVIVIAPYGARQVVIACSCVCVGHEGRPRAAGPRATRVTYTHAATRNNHLSSI